LQNQNTQPLVIYIHGGGFIKGDKSKYYSSEDLVRFLDAGVSVATINYRFMTDAPYGIQSFFKRFKKDVCSTSDTMLTSTISINCV
jgi:carboxylesterase type B